MNAKWRITFSMVAGLLAIAGAFLATGSILNSAARQNTTAVLALGNIIYVDQDAPGPAHNGLSWTTAYTDVQQALTAAISGTEIWVAEGVYYPGAYVTSTFVLTDGVALYGGFAATETLRTQRDWTAHITVLSGDLDHNDITDTYGVVTTTANITGSNAYHVVYTNNVNSTAVLDGFSITAGKTSESVPDDRGGGMFNTSSSPQVANVTFSGNRTYLSGGGVYNYSSSLTLTNVTFSGNRAWSGGGMYNDSSSPTLKNVTFSGNQAGNGGGMYNARCSSPTLTNVTFSGNQTSYEGGGIRNHNSSPTLTNVTFSSNRASSYGGGGMYNGSNSSPTLTNVMFSGNQSSYGGGMTNWTNSSPTLTNVTFSGNQTDDGGGGMYNYNGSSPTLTNVMFSGNQTSQRGGGMTNWTNSSPTLTNVTFSGNQAGDYGGGMYNSSNSSPALANCILWGDSPDEIYNYSSVPVITYSDVYTPTSIYTGTGNLNTDPFFVAPITATGVPTTTGNYRLLTGSPAINTGNSLSVTVPTDLDGRPRIIGAAVDMGAYEFGYQVYLPLVRRN